MQNLFPKKGQQNPSVRFEIENREKFLLIVGMGIITFLALSLNLLILPSLFPAIFLKKFWIVWKEIFWNLWNLFIISFGYFLSYKLLGILEFDFYMMLKLILIAFFPITLLIVFNQNRLLRLHLKTANDLNSKHNESKHVQDKLVHFDSEYQKDKLSIKARLLLLIRSADNYIEIFIIIILVYNNNKITYIFHFKIITA